MKGTRGPRLQQTLGAVVAVYLLPGPPGSTQRLLVSHPGRLPRLARHPGPDVGHPQLVVELLGAGPGEPERHLLLG